VVSGKGSVHAARFALSERVLSLHLWLRFAVLWFAVVPIGFVEG